MKELLFLLVLAVLSSQAYAYIVTDVAGCGNDIRCKFRVATESNEVSDCNSLDGSLAEECRDVIVRQTVMSAPEQREDFELPAFTISEAGKSTFLGTVIVALAFLFIIFFLLVERHKHENFMKSNPKLVSYVKESLDKGLHDNAIKVRLKDAGWDEGAVKEALRDAKKVKKNEL
jgi:hypothetical protein